MSRPGGRIPKIVKDACHAFALERKIPMQDYAVLVRVAHKSYQNTPLALRDLWTLEEIMKQGLL